MKLFVDTFREMSSWKTGFSKKVHVRKPHESSIRMGVGEGSPEKQKSKTIETNLKKTFENRHRKRDGKSKKKPSKNRPNRR